MQELEDVIEAEKSNLSASGGRNLLALSTPANPPPFKIQRPNSTSLSLLAQPFQGVFPPSDSSNLQYVPISFPPRSTLPPLLPLPLFQNQLPTQASQDYLEQPNTKQPSSQVQSIRTARHARDTNIEDCNPQNQKRLKTSHKLQQQQQLLPPQQQQQEQQQDKKQDQPHQQRSQQAPPQPQQQQHQQHHQLQTVENPWAQLQVLPQLAFPNDSSLLPLNCVPLQFVDQQLLRLLKNNVSLPTIPPGNKINTRPAPVGLQPQQDSNAKMECPICKQLVTSVFLHCDQNHRDVLRKKCPYPACQKVFRDSWKVRIHINVHTGEKPFCCKPCGLSFRDLSHLSKHNRSVHRQYKRQEPKADAVSVSRRINGESSMPSGPGSRGAARLQNLESSSAAPRSKSSAQREMPQNQKQDAKPSSGTTPSKQIHVGPSETVSESVSSTTNQQNNHQGVQLIEEKNQSTSSSGGRLSSLGSGSGNGSGDSGSGSRGSGSRGSGSGSCSGSSSDSDSSDGHQLTKPASTPAPMDYYTPSGVTNHDNVYPFTT